MDILKKSKKFILYFEMENSPENIIFSLLDQFQTTQLQNCYVVCLCTYDQIWENNRQTLEIVYCLNRNQEKKLELTHIYTSKILRYYKNVKGDKFVFKNKTITVNINSVFYEQMVEKFKETEPIFSICEPFQLKPVFIPKPWGQEIWFTGVEKRGVSCISPSPSAYAIPQPWLFVAAPQTLKGKEFAQKNLVLIKTLDPKNTPILGDLYYELHQEKNEVYVVTKISGNQGRIKMGINSQMLEKYDGQFHQLKLNFLSAIEKYELVRRQIDALESQNVPLELKEKEILLRNEMDDFCGYLNLNVGDVIAVPILVPHALQHGVQVIEFQTPTYERLIISFAQKVLTQNHWDSKKALEIMKVEEPKNTNLEILFKNEFYLVEQVCSFKDFYSIRVTLNENSEYQTSINNFYQILVVVDGEGKLILNEKEFALQAGQSFFVPTNLKYKLITKSPLICLICAPARLNLSYSK